MEKLQHMREGKSLFEKKNLNLVTVHWESHMITCQGGWNQPRKKSLGYVCVIISS